MNIISIIKILVSYAISASLNMDKCLEKMRRQVTRINLLHELRQVNPDGVDAAEAFLENIPGMIYDAFLFIGECVFNTLSLIYSIGEYIYDNVMSLIFLLV